MKMLGAEKNAGENLTDIAWAFFQHDSIGEANEYY